MVGLNWLGWRLREGEGGGGGKEGFGAGVDKGGGWVGMGVGFPGPEIVEGSRGCVFLSFLLFGGTGRRVEGQGGSGHCRRGAVAGRLVVVESGSCGWLGSGGASIAGEV